MLAAKARKYVTRTRTQTLDLGIPLARPHHADGPPPALASCARTGQIRPVWDRAAQMILTVAETGKRVDVAEGSRQVLVALEEENWVNGVAQKSYERR